MNFFPSFQLFNYDFGYEYKNIFLTFAPQFDKEMQFIGESLFLNIIKPLKV